MWHILAFWLVLLASPLARAAAPTITNVTGSSGYTTTGTITVYGGLAGTCNAGADIYSTCNSCDSVSCPTAPLCACNKSKIYDGLILRVYLQSDSGVTGNARVRTSDGQTLVNIQTLGNGGTMADINWTDICTRANNGSGTAASTNCAGLGSGNNTATLKVWVDTNANDIIDNNEVALDVQFRIINPAANQWDVLSTNNGEGVDAFTPYPGDEKVYVEQLHSSSGFPGLSYSTKVTALRVFVSDTNLDDATANSGFEPQDIKIVDDGTTTERPIVDGLQNDKLYFFRLALVDEAGNLVQYFPGKDNLDPSCTTSPGTEACPYAATPSEVVGLLSKDMNCFIATAAYGSSLEPKLNVFREFRHRILLPNAWGLSFVKWYYHYGPYAARWLSDKPVARAIVRGALYPAYGFSELALAVGFAKAAALVILGTFGLAGAAAFALRRRHA